MDIAEKILEFNNKNQTGYRLKILIPDQMLNRLPITLAQLLALKNSQKLKSEIRQLSFSLHFSKKNTKTVYNSLIRYV